MNTKKKTIISIAGVACGAAFVLAISPVTSAAEALVDTPIIQSEVSALPQIQNSTHIQEGYGSAEVWQQILSEEKNQQELFVKALLADYGAYFTDEENANISSLLEKIKSASTIAEISPYEEALIEMQAIGITRYDEAQAQAILEAEKEVEAEAEAAQVDYAYYDNSYNNVYTSTSGSYDYSTESYDYSSSSSVSDATWSGDSSSAKAWIVERESGGSYTATNGRYYGAYQLDISYLGGDLSPENQDAVAEEYVNSRYGGWEGAVSHWQSTGWY